MLACTLNVEESDILRAVNLYTDALVLLDQYDHQTLRSQKEISRFTGSLMKIAVIWSMPWRICFIPDVFELKQKKVN